jgi:hypothetical protein
MDMSQQARLLNYSITLNVLGFFITMVAVAQASNEELRRIYLLAFLFFLVATSYNLRAYYRDCVLHDPPTENVQKEKP